MIWHSPTPEAMKPSPSDVDLYARALSLSHGSRKTPMHMHVANLLYWGMIAIAFGWVFSMTIDREIPVRQISREIVSLTGRSTSASAY
jgi:hypothetical protein